jgi:hypothetical protein
MKRTVTVILVLLCMQGVVAGQQECPVPPVEGSEDIVILRVQYAATYTNDEFIVIYNKGDITVDLSGWVVFNSFYDAYRNLPEPQRADPAAWKNVYKIPYGFTLEPNHWVRISSGRGTDNELYLYRNMSEQWLEDDGDIVYLMDESCNVIDEYSWP